MDKPCAKETNNHIPPHELIKLVCKLRWIGREKEAFRIQLALGRRTLRNDDVAVGREIGIDWQGLMQSVRLERVFTGSF